jgi:Zn-dependent protease
MVDERRIRWRLMRVMVSLAGPLMSAAAGLVIAAPFYLGHWSPSDTRPLVVAAGMLVQLQAMAVLFNLLPIPPMDGFQAIASLLFSYETKRRLMRSAGAGMGIFLVLVIFFRGLRHALWGIAFTLTAPLGLTYETFHRAFNEFRFWM